MAKSISSDKETKSDLSKCQSVLTRDDENKESTTLIWFDPNIGSHEDTEQTKQQLRLINDYVTFHTDLQLCLTFIQSIDKEKIFLVTSGSKASQILPHLSSLRQIDSIFIALSAMYYSITQLAKAALALGTSIHDVFELETTDTYQPF